MTAMRALIGWMYSNTKSVPLAQLMHASSTGSLVMLSPPRVNARQEVVWYLVYAAALWVTVGLIAGFFDSRFGRSGARSGLVYGYDCRPNRLDRPWLQSGLQPSRARAFAAQRTLTVRTALR